MYVPRGTIRAARAMIRSLKHCRVVTIEYVAKRSTTKTKQQNQQLFHVEQFTHIYLMQTVKENIRMVEDFPEKGVVFVDLTTVFKKPECMKKIEDALYETYKNSGATKVIGIESRGFFFSTILANRIGAGFVPLRKKGKLPAETLEVSYQKEYGMDTIQIHKDALTEDDIVILHDDILATGGTIKAAIELIKKFNVKKIYISFIGEIDFLKGRDKIENDVDVDVLIHF